MQAYVKFISSQVTYLLTLSIGKTFQHLNK